MIQLPPRQNNYGCLSSVPGSILAHPVINSGSTKSPSSPLKPSFKFSLLLVGWFPFWIKVLVQLISFSTKSYVFSSCSTAFWDTAVAHQERKASFSQISALFMSFLWGLSSMARQNPPIQCARWHGMIGWTWVSVAADPGTRGAGTIYIQDSRLLDYLIWGIKMWLNINLEEQGGAAW